MFQMAGRGTRPAPEVSLGSLSEAQERVEAIRQSSKPVLTLIDVVDACDRHRVSAGRLSACACSTDA
jgi:type I site-specific restriction endonuclease